ncbi:WGR domain-containing protein [Actinomadura sp. WMMB 499]|uniref:WGR domain-containing protein n=1 Tax=Actinomadura sp. WMMB 499 TaxID=1219491 RepID=UPI0012444C46|nr:WGR domain-containing protein [Actinomadura sp. WMMB 499]QFG23269.1 WGR domain-containing protein [Actinomadura sp. WMMB 499]
MAEHRTYLELSEDDGSAHKFYEVVRSGTRVTITYGRIGTSGQTKVSDFATEAKAEAAAAKKIAEKARKGYAPAVRGVRAARPVSRRTIESRRSTANRAPVLWRFASGAAAFGIFVDEERCWVGNQRGDVYTVTHDGTVTGRYRLPDGVKCIVADDFWIYAGCDDGRVYDLSGKVPHVAYEISADVDIYWLDIDDAVLGVSDRNGGLTAVDHEDEFQWSRDVDGDSAWMVRCDAGNDAVFHGHSRGVARYAAGDGKEVWRTRVGGNVLFGWQGVRSVYAATGQNDVYRLAKADGAVEAVYQCDAAVFSCAASADGRYVFAGDNHSSIYCFDADGTRLWKLGSGYGSAYSMQFLDDRVYIVTTDGSLVCIDASEAAIRAAQQGTVPKPVDVKVAASLPVAEPVAVLETTSQPGDAILVECYQDGPRLRVRVISEGFEQGWNVQFPKGIREAGARYAVEGVRTSERGGFYRAYGEIKRLV